MIIEEWDKQREDGLWMKIDVLYSLGGMNYFSGKKEPRGYRVALTTVERDNYGEKYAPMDNRNFKIFVKEVKRRSKKVEKELVEYVGSIIDELFELYEKMDKEEIFNKIREFNKKG